MHGESIQHRMFLIFSYLAQPTDFLDSGLRYHKNESRLPGFLDSLGGEILGKRKPEKSNEKMYINSTLVSG